MNIASLFLLVVGGFFIINGISGLLFKVVYQKPSMVNSWKDFFELHRFVRGKEASALGIGYLILGMVALYFALILYGRF